MKKLSIFFSQFLLAVNFSFGQIETDTVDMSGGFTMDVFYSLEDGSIQTVASAEWTVAFSTGAQTTSLYINEASGVELFNTNLLISDFEGVLDTTGINGWPKLHNGHSSWNLSAFEDGATGHPNYGWGNYNMATNSIEGNKVFVIKTLTNEYFKASIIKKENGAWFYRYAHLDNSFDTLLIYQATDLQNKNFAYLNMENHLIADREAAQTDWELLFTQYFDVAQNNTFTGVLLNHGIEAATVDNVASSAATLDGLNFENTTNTVGFDWYTLDFNTGIYTLEPNKTFFIKRLDGSIYKLYFTRLDGESTGIIGFSKERLTSTDVHQIQSIQSVSIYPNPSKNRVNIALNLKEKSPISYSVYNIIGKEMTSLKSQNFNRGLNVLNINTSGYPTGTYVLQIKSGQESQNFKLIVQ